MRLSATDKDNQIQFGYVRECGTVRRKRNVIMAAAVTLAVLGKLPQPTGFVILLTMVGQIKSANITSMQKETRWTKRARTLTRTEKFGGMAEKMQQRGGHRFHWRGGRLDNTKFYTPKYVWEKVIDLEPKQRHVSRTTKPRFKITPFWFRVSGQAKHLDSCAARSGSCAKFSNGSSCENNAIFFL